MNHPTSLLSVCALLGASLLTPACLADAPGDPSDSVVDDGASTATETSDLKIQPFVALTLQNGWTNAPFATRNAGIFFDPNSGITHFSGAIAGGTSSVVFTVPGTNRPTEDTWIPVDLCGAAKGRLHIATTGVVDVQEENGMLSTAQCFISLEGASYAGTSAGFSALTLQNSWVGYTGELALFGTLGGAMRFRGAIASGTTGTAFNLPAGFRPTNTAYVAVDLCSATNGRLVIQPSGDVSVQAEGAYTNAQCFTSLDGAWFLQGSAGATPLTLVNGWTSSPYGTITPAIKNVAGIAHFQGAISSGTSATAFTLPAGFAPTSNVYVSVDLCNSTKGRLLITSSGSVSVQAENGTFSNAQCFTSLDGVSYSIAGF